MTEPIIALWPKRECAPAPVREISAIVALNRMYKDYIRKSSPR